MYNVFIWFFLAAGTLSFTSCDQINVSNANLHLDKLQTTGMAEDQPKSSGDGLEKGRNRWAALSLPDNTSCRIEMDWSTGIAPLNNTFTYLTLVLPFRFVLPTYKTLNEQYGRLNRLENDLSDQETGSLIDYEFLEEQRANEQRRTIYQHIETMFSKFGLDGKICLKRAICELAEAPLGHHGLLGKLIHVIFSPSLIKWTEKMKRFMSVHSNNLHRMRRDADLLSDLELMTKAVDDEYTHAYRTGKRNQCWVRFSSCPISLFTLLRI